MFLLGVLKYVQMNALEDVNEQMMSSSEIFKATNKQMSSEWNILPAKEKFGYKEKARQYYAAQVKRVEQNLQTAELTRSRTASNIQPAYDRINS